MKVLFSNSFWSRFGETIRKALFFESSFRYDFGLGSRDVREVCKFYKDKDTFAVLQKIIVENKLVNSKDEFNTVARIMKWVNSTYPSSVYYLADEKEVWNDPVVTLNSFNRRKLLKELNPKYTVSQLHLIASWKNEVSTDCDDYAILIYNLCRVAGVDSDKLFLNFMATTSKGIDAWHMNVMYYDDFVPYAVEGTYLPSDAMKNFGKVPYFNIDHHKYVRWSWNEDKVFRYNDKINPLVKSK